MMFAYEEAVRDATALLNAAGLDDVQFTGETEQSDSGETWLPFTTRYFDQPTVVVDSEGNVRLEPWTYLIYPKVALETKAVRRVRTPEGQRRFGQPIGSVIVRDIIPVRVEDLQIGDLIQEHNGEWREIAGRSVGYFEPAYGHEMWTYKYRLSNGGTGYGPHAPKGYVYQTQRIRKETVRTEAPVGSVITQDIIPEHPWMQRGSSEARRIVKRRVQRRADTFTTVENLGPMRWFNRWLNAPGTQPVPRGQEHNHPVPKRPDQISQRFSPSIRYPDWDVYDIQGRPARVWQQDDGVYAVFIADLNPELEPPVFVGASVDEALDKLQARLSKSVDTSGTMPLSDYIRSKKVHFGTEMVDPEKVHSLPEQGGVTIQWMEDPVMTGFWDTRNQMMYSTRSPSPEGDAQVEYVTVEVILGVPGRGRYGETKHTLTFERDNLEAELAKMQMRYAATLPRMKHRVNTPVKQTFDPKMLYHETSSLRENMAQQERIEQQSLEHLVLIGGDSGPDTGDYVVPSPKTRGYINSVMTHYTRKYGPISPLIGRVRLTHQRIPGNGSNYAAYIRDNAMESPIHGTSASEIALNGDFFTPDGLDESPARIKIKNEIEGDRYLSWSSVDAKVVADHLGITEEDAFRIGVLHHEVGHAISNIILGDNPEFERSLPLNVRLVVKAAGMVMFQWLDKIAITGNDGSKALEQVAATRQVSGAGAVNVHEHLAEVWAAYNLMPDITKYEQDMGKLMDETFQIIASNFPPDPTPEEVFS